ncbi:hypothetical protein TNIN_173251 [Trichonephila inaurata madagascariensis]|uniref:Uncharacterized protein n=1 Tax=Trichonephila inaurata madagascariensis TaxID=2747483 RepID=A0A8X6Y1J6_9ARAC|nr:hypothetical protein TNIN_173251 [Trichonephila inaurata madagascariensis]
MKFAHGNRIRRDAFSYRGGELELMVRDRAISERHFKKKRCGLSFLFPVFFSVRTNSGDGGRGKLFFEKGKKKSRRESYFPNLHSWRDAGPNASCREINLHFHAKHGHHWPGISLKSNQGGGQCHQSTNPVTSGPPRIPSKPFILPNHSRADDRFPKYTAAPLPQKVTGYVISMRTGGLKQKVFLYEGVRLVAVG